MMISPGQFLYNEIICGATSKDYEDLCVWLLSNNIENPIVLDVASNGTNFFDFDFKKNIILDSAGINNLSLQAEIKFVEKYLIEEFNKNEISLRILVNKMANICTNKNLYEEYGIWYALDETLDYYLNDGKVTMFYELKGDPIKAAIEILKNQNRI